jgi:hypothetical protein
VSTASGRRIRIGIDTGGTFTDVVAFDEDSGELVTTKTPSTPGNPADGFMSGIDKVLDLLGLPQGDGDPISAVSHGTTVATNQLLEGKVDRLGYITTEGYEAMLEIARQSVPDGYGNSYFWVKPDRIVPRHLVKGVGGRLDFTGAEVRPFDEDGARAVARWFRERGVDTLGVCFLHAYADSRGFTAASTRVVMARSYSRYSRSTSLESDTTASGCSSARTARIRSSWAGSAYACRKQTPRVLMPWSLNQRAAARADSSSNGRTSAPVKSSRPPTPLTRWRGTIRSGLTQKYELP